MTTRNVLWALAAIALILPGQVALGEVTSYWSFDTDFTNDPSTTGGSAWDGTTIGNVTIDAAGAKFGAGGMKIDASAGGTHYLTINAGLADGASDVTVAVMGWYNVTDFGSNRDRFFLWETGSNFSVSSSIQYGYQRWAHSTTGLTFNDITGPAIADETWNHITQVWNGSTNTVKYYHNGVLRDYRYVPVKFQTLASSTFLNIGLNRTKTAAVNFEGYMDEIAVLSHEPAVEVVESVVSGAATPVTAANDVAPDRGIRVVDADRLVLVDTILTDDPSGLTVAADGTVFAGRRNCETETQTESYPVSTSDGGIYQIGAGGNTLIASGHMPSDVVMAANGDLFFTEDFNGKIKRVVSGGSAATDWVTGLSSGTTGDVGPVDLIILSDDFAGGGSLVTAGNGLVVDRTTGSIHVWSPDTSEGATLLHDGTGLSDPKALAASGSQIYVADATSTIFTVDANTGSLTALATSGVAVDNPIDMVVDPLTGDLIVMCDSEVEPTKVLRVDAGTGEVTTMVDTLLDGFKDIYDGYFTVTHPGQWKDHSNLSGMAFSPDGKYLYLAEQDGDAVYKLMVVPEPSVLALLLAGVLALIGLRRRK